MKFYRMIVENIRMRILEKIKGGKLKCKLAYL